jgi:hypothetical protein
MRKSWTQDELDILNEHLNDDIETVCSFFPDRTFDSVHVMWKRVRRAKKMSKTIRRDYSDLVEKEEELSLERKYKATLKEISRLSKLLDASNISDAHKGTASIKKVIGTHKTHVTAIAPLSDVHAGKVVTPDTTFGLNEYNIKICEQRLNNYFNNIVKLIKQHSEHVTVDEFVLALIGDLIDGYIHEEQMIQNEMSSIEALLWVQDKLIAGIEFVLKETEIKIKIPFVCGNHSRNTEKMYFAKATETNYETIIAHAIMKHFKDNPRVEVIFSKANIVFLNVYGKIIRFEHGQSIKFNGGVGGLTVPLIKAINRDQVAKKSDLVVMAHFHTQFDGGRFLVNGSVIGYDKYAIDHHLEYEEPKQLFFLIDDRGRRIQTTQVFLDE